MTVLNLIRHGEADGNLNHRFIGQADVPLSAEGHRQATLVAARLVNDGFEVIVASDLQRTIDTARPLAEALGLEIIRDSRLREVSNGDWTNLTADQIEQRWPDEWSQYRDGADVARPGGEQWADVRRRVVEALVDLDGSGKTAVFTHGGPTLIAAMWAGGITSPGNIFRGPVAPVANASITTISVDPRRLITLNDTGHLPQPGAVPELPIWDSPGAVDE